jgi:hypothetical protein
MSDQANEASEAPKAGRDDHAVRLYGVAAEHGFNWRIEYQDWFIPWTDIEVSPEVQEALDWAGETLAGEG